MAKTIFDLRPDDWHSPDDVLREVLHGDTLARQVLFDALGADGVLAKDQSGAQKSSHHANGWTDAIEKQEGERIARMMLARDHKAIGEYVMKQVLAYMDSVSHSIPRDEDRGTVTLFSSMRPGAF